MHDLVKRLKKTFADTPEEEKQLFNTGATNEEITSFNEKLKEWNIPQPSEAFYDLYRAYNGSHFDMKWDGGFDNGEWLLSLNGIVSSKEAFDSNLENGSYHDFKEGTWWNKKWLPFIEENSDFITVIDFEGSYGGKKGQIIAFDYKAMEDRSIIHESFDKWLETTVAIKEAGLWHNTIGKYEDEDFSSYIVDFSEEQIKERDDIYKSINPKYGLSVPILVDYYLGDTTKLV